MTTTKHNATTTAILTSADLPPYSYEATDTQTWKQLLDTNVGDQLLHVIRYSARQLNLAEEQVARKASELLSRVTRDAEDVARGWTPNGHSLGQASTDYAAALTTHQVLTREFAMLVNSYAAALAGV